MLFRQDLDFWEVILHKIPEVGNFPVKYGIMDKNQKEGGLPQSMLSTLHI